MSKSDCVQLGFSEPFVDDSDRELVAHYSPLWNNWDGGKIGGKPCWINPRDIPRNALRCSICAQRKVQVNIAENKSEQKEENNEKDCEGTILRFLAQIYSPADQETENESAFHRSFYVFSCPHPLCANSDRAHESVVVLRGQMSRENDFYPYECDVDVDGWNMHQSKAWGVDLCTLCGQRGKGRCPLSKQWFCGKEHQKEYHKYLKKQQIRKGEDLDISSLLYNESELVVEEEPVEDKKIDDEDEKELAGKINKDALFSDTDDVDDNGEDDGLIEQSDLNRMTGIDAIGGTSDQITMEFYARIGRAGGDVKGQCLRYCRWPDISGPDSNECSQNGPLWISSENCPNSEDIPPCQYCGAQRKFEFQLMPQIIHILTQNSNKDISTNTDLPDCENALLAASDIIEKAREEGKETELPEGFEKKHIELVEKLKKKVFDDNERRNDNIDFGTISVYTCTRSCGDGNGSSCDDRLSPSNTFGAYRQEFAWRQPPP
mmetsp:Transcript_16772/g.25100  ORF Transcript_16772/g.25100 Transcript_16772/m.25100 type:complete len:490 (-) Transcript_16772:70-1539(-)